MQSKTLWVAMLLTVFLGVAEAQDVAGRWQGMLTLNSLAVLYLARGNDGWRATRTFERNPEQGVRSRCPLAYQQVGCLRSTELPDRTCKTAQLFRSRRADSRLSLLPACN